MDEEEVKDIVKLNYGRIARQGSSCCGTGSSCCGSEPGPQVLSKKIGYSNEEIQAVPEGANLGLGCGNPLALASIIEGETVIDLGSGAGFDSFLAAGRVGPEGRVIGVDMTPEMIARARENAAKGGYENVEFRLGEIENIPVANNHADLIISNCVINLVPDKRRAFIEAYRVLKPGGRLMVSDIVLLKPLPADVLNSVAAYVGCISGASLKENYLGAVNAAGFQDVKVIDEASFSLDFMANDPAAQALTSNLDISSEMVADMAGSVVSVRVSAIKP